MENLEFAKALYARRNYDVLGGHVVCPSLRIGQLAPPTAPRSAARPSRASSQSPKVSSLIVGYDRVVGDPNYDVSAMWSKDGHYLYCEVKKGSNTAVAYLYDDVSKIMYCSEHSNYSLLALHLWGLHPNNTAFSETQAAVRNVMDTAKSSALGTVVLDELLFAYLCDCFYYEGIKYIGGKASSCEIVQMEMDTVKFAEVNQMVRTNNMMFLVDSGLEDYLASTFEHVTSPADEEPDTTASSTSGNIFEDMRNGRYQLGYDWSADQLKKVYPLEFLTHYIPNSEYVKMVNWGNTRLSRVLDRMASGKTGLDAIGHDYLNIMLCGKPGTGKTTTAMAVAAALGMPIYISKATKNTEEDTYEGMVKVDDKGKFILHDTPFLEAYQHGGIVVLEEINLADPAVTQGALGQAIESPFILNRDGYQEIRRHPLCYIIATMNTDVEGAREPNKALTSRFPVSYIMDDPNADDFITILMSRGHSEKSCRWIYKVYTSVLHYLGAVVNNEEMTLCVTLRHCLAALDLVADKIVPNFKAGVRDTIINAIALRDKNIATMVYDNVVKPLAEPR